MSAVPGAPAPDFSLPLVGGGYRGLRDIVDPGGGILLFFKDGCAASELVVSRIGPLARSLEREERLFLAIAQEDDEGARTFRAKHGLEFAVAYEAAPYATSREYGITTVPTLLVVDGAGFVAERIHGFLKSDYTGLGPAIEQALALGGVPPMLDRPEELPELKPG
jgi:peroxiredoxin